MLIRKKMIRILTTRNGLSIQQSHLLPTFSLIYCSLLHTVYPEL